MKPSRLTDELASRSVNKLAIAWIQTDRRDFGSEQIAKRRYGTAPRYNPRLRKPNLTETLY
jgi:hypothetical protein